MAKNFLQFAFLGPHNCYLASVTELHSSGYPSSAPDVLCHGLPDQFSRQIFKKQRYMFNVRGHDYLAHDGHWRSKNQGGHLDARSRIIGEIDDIQRFAAAGDANGSKSGGEELLMTFGPNPGSFFADDRRTRYRWANLPSDLEDAIQRLVCKHGYGKIADVAINAAGGWVIHLKNDDIEFGGRLPERLQIALREGQKKRASIKRLYLNHQNPDEYVLLFKDGRTCICLHTDVEMDLKRLVERSTKKKVHWNFQPSCYCDGLVQRSERAAYYSSRGRFMLFRGEPEQALGYLQEALRLENSSAYWKDYGMALVAVRSTRLDPILESWLCPTNPSQQPLYDPHDEDGFRSDYFKVVGRQMSNFDALSSRLQRVKSAGLSPYWGYATSKQFMDLTPQLDNAWEEARHLLAELPAIASEKKNISELGSSGAVNSPAASPIIIEAETALEHGFMAYPEL